MERVHMDILGPFTKSKKGNAYILMITDQFIKWIEAIPIPNQTAETIANACMNDLCMNEGYLMQSLFNSCLSIRQEQRHIIPPPMVRLNSITGPSYK